MPRLLVLRDLSRMLFSTPPVIVSEFAPFLPDHVR